MVSSRIDFSPASPRRLRRLGALAATLALLGCVPDEDPDASKAEASANAGEGDDMSPPADDATGGDDGTTSDDDTTTDASNATNTDTPDSLPVDESAPLVGRFLLTLQAPKADKVAVTSFNGNVGDAPYPELTVWELAEEDAASGCRLLVPRVPNCAAGCGADACVEDETCSPYPVRHSVGDITVKGVHTTAGADSITIAPQKPRLDYVKTASVTLEYPPAPEGESLLLTSTGGDYTPLAIEITAIAPLELEGEGKLEMSPDVPLALAWAAAGAGNSLIQIKVDISHHGGAKGKIACETEDDGALEIPANLTKGLIDLGVAGYPTVEVTRVARGIGNVEVGRVEFQSISMRDRELQIPGLTSCMTDDDCPEAQVCQVTRSCG